MFKLSGRALGSGCGIGTRSQCGRVRVAYLPLQVCAEMPRLQGPRGCRPAVTGAGAARALLFSFFSFLASSLLEGHLLDSEDPLSDVNDASSDGSALTEGEDDIDELDSFAFADDPDLSGDIKCERQR